MDFSAMPALTRLWAAPHVLHGAPTLSAAPALKALHLGRSLEDYDTLQLPWVFDLLGSVPHSLQELSLSGWIWPEAFQAVQLS